MRSFALLLCASWAYSAAIPALPPGMQGRLKPWSDAEYQAIASKGGTPRVLTRSEYWVLFSRLVRSVGLDTAALGSESRASVRRQGKTPGGEVCDVFFHIDGQRHRRWPGAKYPPALSVEIMMFVKNHLGQGYDLSPRQQYREASGERPYTYVGFEKDRVDLIQSSEGAFKRVVIGFEADGSLKSLSVTSYVKDLPSYNLKDIIVEDRCDIAPRGN